jgi:hypothetical protein
MFMNVLRRECALAFTGSPPGRQLNLTSLLLLECLCPRRIAHPDDRPNFQAPRFRLALLLAMKEYDLFVPLSDNSGKPVDSGKLNGLKRRLVDSFGGLTNFPQENEGFWKVGPVLFRDKIIIYRVLSDDSGKASEVFHQIKAEMKADWGQSDVLIIARDVETL